MTAAKPRLLTPPFLALAIASLAFFTAGGIVLPVAPRFAKFALGADAIGVGVAIGAFSVAALLLRPIVGDRLRARLLAEGDGSGTRELLAAVAEHRLDPFSAADELIGKATGP